MIEGNQYSPRVIISTFVQLLQHSFEVVVTGQVKRPHHREQESSLRAKKRETAIPSSLLALFLKCYHYSSKKKEEYR